MTDSLSILLSLDDLLTLAFAMGVLVLAYAVFTLAGFGSALLASAPLAAVMPVARVVPLLAVLDCAGSVLRGYRARRAVARGELRRLVPGMVAGQMGGVVLLAHLPAAGLAVLLGGFVASYGGWRLAAGAGPGRLLRAKGAGPLFALSGGVLGGLFGSGGFVYAAYLQARLDDREAFRATQAVLIALSSGWRIVLCILAGLVDAKLLMTAMVLLPAALLGGLLGRHIDLRLSREKFSRFISLLLLASGLALAMRHIG